MPPRPAAMCGTRAPTAKKFVATAMPNWPLALSLAMIDHVISVSSSASGRVALHAARIGGGATALADFRSGGEAAFRPVGAGFDHMATAGQFLARCLGYAVLHHEHAGARSARPARYRALLRMPRWASDCL